ncbi:hypothetical protein LAZ67_12003485 [Cordylochernes scorpioides]|uniref:Mos1 transposase HTH domain-containing protein n=1 Tax=Cordylochernes scorpioides TaxID=51811 RepID=A0ABY6L6D3_9ARAC|nr:hypothetical protein LAZ67_12003485 [Cordylochernes scorpioides]
MEDQRICIKFCAKNGFKGTEFFWILQTAYGDVVMSRRRVFEWYKRFKEGREETADNKRSGRPSMRPSTSTTPEKVDKVLELVREDRRITVREVAEEEGISFGSTQLIMKDILGRVITGDETWIYGFDSEITQQASEWRFKNEPRPKKAREALSKSRFGPLRLLPFWKAKKKKLKGQKFQSIEEIKVESKKAMKAIPKTDYQRFNQVASKEYHTGKLAFRAPSSTRTGYLWSALRLPCPILSHLRNATPGHCQQHLQELVTSEIGNVPHVMFGFLEIGNVPHVMFGFLEIGNVPHVMFGFLEIGTVPYVMFGFLEIGNVPHVMFGFIELGIAPHVRFGFLELGIAPHVMFGFLELGIAPHVRFGFLELGIAPHVSRVREASVDVLPTRGQQEAEAGLDVSTESDRGQPTGQSIQKIADTLHMSTFVVHGIVTEDLQMRKVCAKLLPKVLTQDQKELRVVRCQELLDLIQNELDFLNSVVTGDESWMFKYDPESKRQSCAWHTKSSPRPKKARMSKSRIKTIIIVFFDIRGIVHCEFVPQGQTVNSAFYLEVLRRLKRRIARVRTDIKDTVKLHHDNATSHTAFIITNFLARSNTPVIPHSPYSPDLAPCDFFLFPRLKREMKGKHWETVENIQHHVTTFLRSIPVEEFQGTFQARKCIDEGRMYFEEY